MERIIQNEENPHIAAAHHIQEVADTHELLTGQEAKELALETIDFLQNVGGEYFENVGDLYQYVDKQVVVRREDPSALIGTMIDGPALDIGFHGDRPYSNAVLWDNSAGAQGLANTFLEGRAHSGGICFVAGYEADGFEISRPDSSDIGIQKIGGDGKPLDRSRVVAASGVVSKNEVKFIVARIPIQFMPEEYLTDEEVEGGEKNVDGNLRHVFRGVLLKQPHFN